MRRATRRTTSSRQTSGRRRRPPRHGLIRDARACAAGGSPAAVPVIQLALVCALALLLAAVTLAPPCDAEERDFRTEPPDQAWALYGRVVTSIEL